LFEALKKVKILCYLEFKIKEKTSKNMKIFSEVFLLEWPEIFYRVLGFPVDFFSN